jgi:hypothetical protein
VYQPYARLCGSKYDCAVASILENITLGRLRFVSLYVICLVNYGGIEKTLNSWS